jgi:NlpC/P60 family putative phage cell wall peptidase
MIVDEARTWIGTPYRHQHSTKGAGCDCLGLLRGVYRNVIGPEPETPPPYSASWGEAGISEHLLNAAERWLKPAPLDEAQVLIFRMRHGMIAKHCGIVSSPGYMIHADAMIGFVTETELTPYWRSKIVSGFRF